MIYIDPKGDEFVLEQLRAAATAREQAVPLVGSPG
jgi:hypothetical protein